MSMEVAAIILRRPTGEFFVHHRRADKKIYPNLYGLGAGGKLEDGESPLTGAQRELLEETGIRAKPHFLFSLPFRHDTLEYVLHVFHLVTEDEIHLDTREWQSGRWINQVELDILAQTGKLCPDTRIFYERYCQLEIL